MHLNYPADADVYTSETLLEIATVFVLVGFFFIYRWDIIGRAEVAASKRRRLEASDRSKQLTPGAGMTLTSL
jgi:hypothetical protein